MLLLNIIIDLRELEKDIILNDLIIFISHNDIRLQNVGGTYLMFHLYKGCMERKQMVYILIKF